MCDSTSCDNCGKKYCNVLHPVEGSWKYVCTECYNKIEEHE